tara:strand:+ start:7064 stop:7540 length:477 start_codon:yes stop_codon:yes gene_type:complete
MSEFRKALDKYAKYVIQQSRSNLTRKGNKASGKLSQSLGYKIQGSKVKFESLQYGVYQDQGVKGAKSTYPESSKSPFRYTNKMPPSRVFDKWTIKKGIAPRDEQGRFINRKSLNYLIARSIYKKGIRATMFFTKPFERGLDLFGDEIVAGYIEDNFKI